MNFMNCSVFIQTAIRMATVLSATALTTALQAAPIDSGPVNISVPQDLEGVYLNVVTGAYGLMNAAPGWDVNLFDPASMIAPNPGGLHFYWPTTVPGSTTGGVAMGSLFTNLPAGSTVSAGATFWAVISFGASYYNNFRTSTGAKVLGFRFRNEASGGTHYGYVVMQTTEGSGFPATITRYIYDDTPGAAIAVSDFSGVLLNDGFEDAL
jgi:hypothetical protein